MTDEAPTRVDPAPAPVGAWLPTYAVLSLAWGSAFMFVSLALESFTAVGVSWGKHALGLLVLLPVALVRRRPFPPRALWKHMVVAALLFSVIPSTLFAFAQTYVSSSLAAILNASTPLITLLVIVVAFPEERLTSRRVLGLFVGFGGVLIVLGVWNGVGHGEWIGLVAIAIAVFGPSTGFPYARRYLSGKVDPITLATSQVLVGAVTLLPLLAVTGITHAPVTARGAGGLLAAGVISTGFAYALNFRVLALAGASNASTIAYVLPVVAVIFGALLLHEEISWYEPVGGLVVILGAAITQGRLLRDRSATEPAPSARSGSSADPDPESDLATA